MSSDHTLPSGTPPGLSLLKILAAGLFAAGIASEVVGVPLDQISVSRVAGASLTTQGFMTALDAIKSEAVDS